GVVDKPAREHPKRTITGFECTRSEVSGTRLWGVARSHFKTAARFCEEFFVLNYCPLVFMDDGVTNLTPDHLLTAVLAALSRARAGKFVVCESRASALGCAPNNAVFA